MRIKKTSKLKISGSRLKTEMPPLRIGNSVATVPIVQGGMGVGISLSGLASAVANQGGIGVIAANAIGLLEDDYYTNGKEANLRALRKQIRIAKQKTDGIIGVNIMVAVNDFQELLRVAMEEKADMVFLGAGLPLKGIPAQELADNNVKVVPIVSSARAVKLIFRYWEKNYGMVPDAVVVEGPKAGGHLGFKLDQIDDPDFSLFNILPPVVKEVITFEKKFDKEIPVIAGGGVYDGNDIYKLLKLGASGVQMATRFVATHECDADKAFKETYVNCKEEDVTIIKSPVGLPGRAIRNSFLERLESGERPKFRCPWRCLESCKAKDAKYCISLALNNARLGKMDGGYAFAGSNAYRITRITSVKKLVKSLKNDYFKVALMGTVNIRVEIEEALEKLTTLKNQYSKAVRKTVRKRKAELDELLVKGATAFEGEYKNAQVKLEQLKKQYANYLEQINELTEQLSIYFDTSALKLPTGTLT